MNIDPLFIEETLPDKSYRVVWRGTKEKFDEIGEALEQLQNLQTNNRLELWSRSHAESPKGFAPIAFREPYSTKVKICHTLKMLMGNNP